jgi:DNA polymerase
VDFTRGDTVPDTVSEALEDPAVLKWGYDAGRERILLGVALGRRLSPVGWHSTSVLAASYGLPTDDGILRAALGINDGASYKALAAVGCFAHFELPQPMRGKPNVTRRILPDDEPTEWTAYRQHAAALLTHYMHLTQELRRHYGDGREQLWADYVVDQRINDRGICLDYVFANSAAQAVDIRAAKVRKQLTELCAGYSPAVIADALRAPRMDAATKATILSLQTENRMTSVKKYDTMLDCECADGRLHGMFRFFGAHTGRWTSHLVQLQNLPRMALPCLDECRRLLREGDFTAPEMLRDVAPMEMLSQLLRTALVPAPGCRFVICDFAAIEARVLAWLVGEEWVMDILRTSGRLYEATAAQLYGVPEADITHDDPRRAVGKVATLALGYGGGPTVLAQMGGAELGLTDEQMDNIVQAWRRSRPETVNFWSQIEHAYKGILVRQDPLSRGIDDTRMVGRVRVMMRQPVGALTIALPSGRELYYPKAFAKREGVKYVPAYYDTTDGRFGPQTARGPKLTQNIVQAIARDLLADVLQRLDDAGMRVVAHVHDEVIIEAPEAAAERIMTDAQEIFRTPPAWAKDLPLDCSAFLADYYKK